MNKMLNNKLNDKKFLNLLNKYIEKEIKKSGIINHKNELIFPNIIIKKINKKELNNYLDNNTFITKYTVLFNNDELIIVKYNNKLEIEEKKIINENKLDFLIKLILKENNNNIYLTPNNLISLFGNINKNIFMKNILKKFYQFFININSKEKEISFNKWKNLFQISSNKNNQKNKTRRKFLYTIFDIEINNDDIENKTLFVLYNILSIIIKLLIYNNFVKLGLNENINSNYEIIRKIETGEIYNFMKIYNLLKYDYFSWYSNKELWNDDINEIIQQLLSVINKITILETDQIIDYIEPLYKNYIPKEVRHSLGEFFTPSIIAKEVVTNIGGIKKGEKIIDPTCGSGVFLIETIKIKKDNKEKIEKILNNISGIDINPLNILLSKFNIISNFLKELRYIKKNIVIPVFFSDSSYTHDICSIDNIEVIKYKYIINNEKNIEIILPIKFIQSNLYFEYIKNINCLLEKDIKNKTNEFYNFLINKIKIEETKLKVKLLTKEIEKEIKKWIKKIKDYYQINPFEIKYFSLENIYPFTFKYDKIIGNPPWVKWGNLPISYRNRIKSFLKDKELFSEDKNVGGIDLNIYALITYNSIKYLLKEKGELIFLLPKNSLQSKSLEGFRKLCFYRYAKIKEPIYFSKSKIFEEINLDFIIIKLKKNNNNNT